MKNYDVIIVGAGPAGIFTAIELTRHNQDLSVAMFEKGKDITERSCPARQGTCIKCTPCAIMTGWGGAGAFSDGKLTYSPDIGGWLKDYIGAIPAQHLIGYVDSIYKELGADSEVYGTEQAEIRNIAEKAARFKLKLIPNPVKHLGTEICAEILKEARTRLSGKVDVRTKTRVVEVLTSNGAVQGVVLADGSVVESEKVVLAPGREGAVWLADQAKKLGIPLENNAVDIGVRVETKAEVMEPLTGKLYEPKLIFKTPSFQDQVRTFCVNPFGTISTEHYEDIVTVNGHSYADIKTENTNFALLVSTKFTEPFREPIAYGQYIARLANLLGNGIIVQRLTDLKAGRRSTKVRIDSGAVRPTLMDATPGDLSFVLPYRHLIGIIEMLEALEGLTSGVNGYDTLLYGVEVKFYSSRLPLKSNLETEIKGLYAIGDGAGITRGLIQASVAGVVAARSILGKSLV